MPRRRSRGTAYLDSDRELRAIRPRLGLDNSARSTSNEPHNRRKPRLASVARPELTTNAVDSDVLGSGNTNPERAVDTGHIKDNAVTAAKVASVNAGAVGGTGKVGWANVDSPANLVTGSYNGNPGRLGVGDIGGMPDFSKFLTSVPKGYVTQEELKQILKHYKREGGGN
jgi:hypothetical protein